MGVVALGFALLGQDATAKLSYDVRAADEGITYITVSGSFEADDDLSLFRDKAVSSHAIFVGFDSGGGNVSKALELGRLIRSLGLSTLAVRSAECSSACSLSFLGGVGRFAEPGSIGVHKSSFSDTKGMDVEAAVAAVQRQTADVITYMNEMGVDPGLLQLTLRYDSNDMRYLSSSEMTEFRVTTMSYQEVLELEAKSPSRKAPAANAEARKEAQPLSEDSPLLQIPIPRNGIVQDDTGAAPLKTSRNMSAKTIATFPNGSELTIGKSIGDWYRVSIGKKSGYMRQTSVWVREFEENRFGKQYIQILVDPSLKTAIQLAKGANPPMAVHLTVQGRYALTVKDAYDKNIAPLVYQHLIGSKKIPLGATITHGNNYVCEICCGVSAATAE
ncbi:hypothetical protein BJ928_101230 [Rhizobium sp. WW_1]|nr:hypothetical protein BJ928_101230 [Rhizobium sp. WW_1]